MVTETVSLNHAAPVATGNDQTSHEPLRQVPAPAQTVQGDDLPAKRQLPAPTQADRGEQTEPETPSVADTSRDDAAGVSEVIECLREAAEPLTAGQIRYRVGLSEEDWPAIEQQLLQQETARKSGTGRRARFSLASESGREAGGPGTALDANGDVDFESIDAATWFRIAHWAKKNDHLQPWQRGLAYSLGRRRADGIAPTEKQTIQGHRVLQACRELGFFEETGDCSASNDSDT